MKTLAILSLSGTTVFGAICIYKGNEKFYRNVVMPVVHLLDGETSHKLGIIAGKYRLYPKSSFVDPDILVRFFLLYHTIVELFFSNFTT